VRCGLVCALALLILFPAASDPEQVGLLAEAADL
jgi:hypothetical protein